MTIDGLKEIDQPRSSQEQKDTVPYTPKLKEIQKGDTEKTVAQTEAELGLRNFLKQQEKSEHQNDKPPFNPEKILSLQQLKNLPPADKTLYISTQSKIGKEKSIARVQSDVNNILPSRTPQWLRDQVT